MFLHYDDEPARSVTAEIWRDCARRAAAWTGVYVLLAVAVVVMDRLGLLDLHLTVM